MDRLLHTPRLICRWRLSNADLPLENRHMRALGKRQVSGLVTKQLMAWAKQHIEWNLHEGAKECPDGVLMLVVDDTGKATLSIGPYVELGIVDLNVLIDRACLSLKEASETGISPEVLILADKNTLTMGCNQSELSGMASLVVDLAQAHGLTVSYNPNLIACAPALSDMALVSDEHGVVVLPDSYNQMMHQLQEEVARLFLPKK